MTTHAHEWAFNAANSEWFCTDYECHAVVEGMNGYFALTGPLPDDELERRVRGLIRPTMTGYPPVPHRVDREA